MLILNLFMGASLFTKEYNKATYYQKFMVLLFGNNLSSLTLSSYTGPNACTNHFKCTYLNLQKLWI